MKEVYRAVSSIILKRPVLKESVHHEASSLKDMMRKPTEPLYLVVKKPRVHHAWQFPQGGQDPGETGPEAALRELEEECGSDLKVSIEPQQVGVYQYKFPTNFKRARQYTGAKVSFYRAHWISGQCEPDGKEIVDFAWLTREELFDLVHPDYQQAIQACL